MYKMFGKTLRKMMDKSKVKETQLAAILSYDATYINKWINGSKLPSSRNAEDIIEQIADFFVNQTGISREVFLEELKNAYYHDSSHLNAQTYSSYKLSFLDDWNVLYQMIKDVILGATKRNEATISITATFDLFSIYGKAFIKLLYEFRELGIKKIKVSLPIDIGQNQNNSLKYPRDILRTVGSLDDVELTVVLKNKEVPPIIIINELLCLQFLWNIDNDFAVIVSTDEKIIKKFSEIAKIVFDSAEKLLDCTEPINLKQTNVQIGSYSDERLWLFFNSPPAMLFPNEIMDNFIKDARDENYAFYLSKLKSTFSKWTRNSEIDLLLFASTLNKYLSNGEVNLGNVSQKLSKAEVKMHLEYLNFIMKENPKFRIWMIRDTITIDKDITLSPSLFIDTKAVYIENAQKNHTNFHISMDQKLITMFQHYFETILNKSYCNKLTDDELLKYL